MRSNSKHYPFGIIILLSVLVSCAGSDDLAEGRRTYERSDDRTALNHLKPLAQKQDDANAQFWQRYWL